LGSRYSSRFWRPEGFEHEPISLSDKTVADCVESLIGAACFPSGKTDHEDQDLLKNFNESSVLEVMQYFGLPVSEVAQYNEYLLKFCSQPQYKDFKCNVYLQEFSEKILGYKFKNEFLLESAFTHASYVESKVECYQKLEFLGDAVLDMIVGWYLFNKFDNVAPGVLSRLKHFSVNNKTFSLLAYFHGFHRYINSNSAGLISSVVQFSKFLEGEDLEVKLTQEKIPNYIFDPECEPPKVISDVFEALAGALYLDCGMDFTIVFEIYKKFLFPFLLQYVDPEITPLHPNSALTLKCNQLGCKEVSFCVDSLEDGECTVSIKVHNTVFVTQTAKTKKPAKLLAAACALRKIEQEPECIKMLCKCTVNV